ncbi:DNA internalization-related competence protein ComEC/Rec2 [Anaerocolumna aminovalerica]|uniref:Competence protein ComEC n=1 Tax=Anaerocolumna aminovalerica TaxID=1527 RepID=A0A1I5J2I6_9FIRM|nr:DNA internalization-related competence protein ComEC/Rec2 [Anaerocolumna aminovalerica]SFO66889.1 competence protein ComEC [Anaerocolumna aminovalerica]
MNIRRPLVWLLAFYIAGIALYRVSSISIVVIAILLCILVLGRLLLLKCKRRERLSNFGFILGFPILFILGYSLMNHQIKPNKMDQVFENSIKGTVYGKLQSLEDKGSYVVLTLIDNVIDPDTNHIKNNLKKVSLKQNEVYDSVKEADTYQSKKIKVYTSENSNFKIGNILEISGKIEKFQKATNPGQFNEYEFNKIQKIDYKIKAENIKVVDGRYSWFFQTLHDIKNKFIQVYEQILPQKNAGLISAMILGDTSGLDKDIKDLYRENGISHILAISGLNVSLIGMSLFHLLRKLRIPNFIATLLSIFLIFSFGVLTNFSVSTNRAVVMLIVFMCGGVIGRTYDLFSAASLSALIILINSPMEIYNAGFLLSFTAILGMALIYPILKNILGKRNKLVEAFLLTLSIQVITLPVMLYFFYEFPLYSIIINLIILPLSSLIVLIALVAGLAGFIAISLGSFIIGGAHYILNFYEAVCRFGEKLPGRMILIGRPDLWLLAFYYFILIIWILLNTELVRKKTIILLSFLLLIFVKPKNVDLEVTFIDVGQGDCIFMNSPENVTYLIDGGSSDVKEVGKYRIEPFLKSKGIWKVDYVILTHLDTDHISGVLELMESSKNGSYEGNIIIGHLILPDVQEKDQEYMDIVTLAENKGIKVLYIQKGDIIKEKHVTITCLNPSPDALHADNASSVVLSVNYGDFNMLLTGDLEGEGERQVLGILNGTSSLLSPKDKDTDEIINEPIEVTKDYDVLKVAHHGSKNSTFEEFLSVIKPEWAIISCGYNNRYGHPHEELMERLLNINSKILTTPEKGAVTLIINKELILFKCFS